MGLTTARSQAPAVALVMAGVVSVQFGAGLANRMFAALGPAGVTGLRLWFATAVLAVAGGPAAVRAVRAAVAQRAWRDLAVVAGFGVTLGVMNFAIYQSFARIPMGAAVTVEFLGPLAVAIASSRRLLDVLWVVLAGGGVALLGAGGLGGGAQAAGLGFALLAAAAWAGYIVASRATGRAMPGSSGLVVAMVVAAALVTGPAVAGARPALGHPAVLAEGLGVAVLSSVIPYRAELEALRRVPAGVFGIWMSLEPAVAALAGLVLLHQELTSRQWLAVALVVLASAGTARAGRAPPATGRAPAAEPAAEPTVRSAAVAATPGQQ